MIGMNADTGAPMAMLDHLYQSIGDILRTPIGSRVMRREYGSLLYALVDAPLDAVTIIDLIQATAGAIGRWEPRVRVERVRVAAADTGHVTLDLDLRWIQDGTPVKLEGVIV